MLERDRNRDARLDPDEIEKRAGKVPHTGPPSLSHSEPTELGQIAIDPIYSGPILRRRTGRVLIDAQIGGPQTGKPLPV